MRTVTYTYYDTGDASNITVIDEGEGPQYGWAYDLALYYYTHGDLRLALWGKYQVDANHEPIPETYEPLAAREFAYDPLLGPRARYRTIDYDTNGSTNPSQWTQVGDAHWTDYDGVLPYADFDVDGNGVETEVMRYLGTVAQQTVDSGATSFLHGDLIGSTVLTTGGTGVPAGQLAYSAFGEPLGDPNDLGTRYQYAGRWGYETGLLTLQGPNPNLPPITLLHVGARWYQPSIGRFIQRDPIGILGGLNVYSYVGNKPVLYTDPDGEVLGVALVAGGIACVVYKAVTWAYDAYLGAKQAEAELAHQRLRRRRGQRPSFRNLWPCIRWLVNAPNTSVGFGPMGVPTDPVDGAGAIINEILD